jgi:hypothetical protein
MREADLEKKKLLADSPMIAIPEEEENKASEELCIVSITFGLLMLFSVY